MSDLKIFAVVGRPVLHSLSPPLFNIWFRAERINAVYTRLAAASAEDAVRTARAMKLAGFNVTSPFKEEIVSFLDGVDVHAARIGAVNGVVVRNARWMGFNTDYLGVVRALTRNGTDPRGKRAAVVGAGGAARGAAYGLLRRRAQVTFLNRTEDRAREAARSLGCAFAPIRRAKGVIRGSDILISCVSSRTVPLERYHRDGQPYMRADYRSSRPNAGLKRPADHSIDGLEWLIEQAIPAFRRFTGRPLPARLARSARAANFAGRLAGRANIALVGFTGSGKTATGRALARILGWDLVDTDAEIEKASGMSIPEIFAMRGEPFFRNMEKSLIAECAPAAKNTIFALGGGAVLDRGTRGLLTRHCHVIWLWTSLESALARIDLQSRPVLAAAGGERAIEQVYRARFRASARMADLVLNTDGPLPVETAERIRYEVDQTFED